MKRLATDCRKIFANHISDEGLVSRLYTVSKLNSKNASNTIRKWAKDMSRHFIRKHVQMANKHMKRCSTSLAIRKCKK